MGTAGLLLWRRLAVPREFSVLVFLNLASLAVSTAVSTRPGLSLMGTSWREFGLIPQAAALMFAWTVAAACGERPCSPARSGGRGHCRRRLRHRAIFRMGPAAAGRGLSYRRRHLDHRAAAGHDGLRQLLRHVAGMAAFLGVALAQDESHRVWRCLAWGSTAICAFAMLLTGTRAAMLGLAAGAAVWLFIRGAGLIARMARRVATAAAVIALAGAAFYFSPAGWNLRSRARWFAEDPSGGGRLLLWRDTLRMPAARPLAGFGPETFTAQFAHFESAELARQRPDFEWESPHNMFLDALAAQGVPGLIALAALCGAALWAGFRGPREAMTAGLTAALVAGIVCQQFSAMTIPTALMLYVICALIMRRGGRATPFHAAVRIPLAVVFAAFAIRLAASDHSLAQAQNRLKARDSAGAAASYASYRSRLLPGELAADLWYSRGRARACAAHLQSRNSHSGYRTGPSRRRARHANRRRSFQRLVQPRRVRRVAGR